MNAHMGLSPAQKEKVEKELRRQRQFSLAELSMIRKLGGILPRQELLGLLNDRIPAGQVPYSPAQLDAAISGSEPASARGELDFSGMRKLISAARKNGTLGQISEERIHDFCVLFNLKPRQFMHLKDILLSEPGCGRNA